MLKSSVPAVLRERASLQPNDEAVTFVDYEQDWSGVAETLTWSQLYRRSLSVAHELQGRASPGDRTVILAPQGLDYIVGFLGALQAGVIAVPLSVPLGGVSDERVSSVVADASPSVILTTSSVRSNLAEYLERQPNGSVPSVIEVDLLDPDAGRRFRAKSENQPSTAYVQYTSGSTRVPAGVTVSHKNILANFEQLTADYFLEYGKVAPQDTTVVSWLPFYHDMGLFVGVVLPVMAGLRAVLTSPASFLQRPARWMQLLASHSHAFSAGPNFAFELAARKTSDEDMAGLDLGDVLIIISGSERVQPATLDRFAGRFARFNLPDTAVRPSYGMAEAGVYLKTRTPAQPPHIVYFDSEQLTAGHAQPSARGQGTPLVSYGQPLSPMIRVVDPETSIESPSGTVGEIWVHGENISDGYWGKPEETKHTFGGRLVTPSDGTPEGPWLRTGDLGVFSDDELFIIGRIKDLLIVYGRNHSPDDIEATIQEITRARCAAIAVSDAGTEKLVAIIELRNRDGSQEQAIDKLADVKREVTSAISNTHGLSVSDLVLVPQGSIPITTSGKVRRAMCVEQYRQDQFARLDA